LYGDKDGNDNGHSEHKGLSPIESDVVQQNIDMIIQAGEKSEEEHSLLS
jgi:hypothetical protein